MKEFVYVAQPMRVIFGAGALKHLPREIELLGAKKALVLATPEQAADAERVAAQIGSHAAGVYARAVMHVPIETAREARELARRLGADCAVAIGGGSTTGLGKAIALDSGLPILAIPTTYAGSVTLPVGLSITSGMNAIAHAAEGLYAKDGNPIMDLMAEEGIRAMAGAIPALKRDARDLEARGRALYGAWLCGAVLGNVGMALHHKLCHTLGGSFNLPHAEVHTVVLPHAIAYNARAVPDAMMRLGRALQTDTPAAALYDLARANGAPYALRELGLAAADLDRAADSAVANPYWNPRPIERDAVRALLQNAWAGTRPE
jgi:maleylacetate reductase